MVLAYPTQVVYNDGPQDPLVVPADVHELGTAPVFTAFPDEFIFADAEFFDIQVCFDTSPDNIPDDDLVPNAVIRMSNNTGIAWKEVWYVADEETYHSNFDGWVGETSALMTTAFRIDSKVSDPGGVHHPLIGESMTPDDIFEPGEWWQFVIQDYSNTLGLLASDLGSIGVPSLNPGVNDLSSGSIIAVPVPEPATMLLLGLGGVLLRRKRKA